MRVHRGFDTSPGAERGIAAAIGNFDGVHRGHRAVIDEARRHATALGAELGVITFEPHPRELLTPADAPSRLSPFRRKAELLRALGVDRLLVLPFSRRLMAMSAEDFVSRVLHETLGVTAVVSGETFRFGNRRKGDVALLRRSGGELGMRIGSVEPIAIAGEVCSSTRIREALSGGDVRLAAELLGYEYELIGAVRPGDRRGKGLGFPTANTYPLHPRVALPAQGIYAVRAGIVEGERTSWHPAAANLGTNPTFGGVAKRLEVHLLDGSDYDLYGRRLRVAFLERLRDEVRFDSVDALVKQMRHDCERALAVCAGIAA